MTPYAVSAEFETRLWDLLPWCYRSVPEIAARTQVAPQLIAPLVEKWVREGKAIYLNADMGAGCFCPMFAKAGASWGGR